jgi:hypothetical protein
MKMISKIAGCLLFTGLMTGAAAAQYAGGPQYGPPPAGYSQGPDGGWDAPPREFAEAQRRGFRDGVDGARKDFENHRPPNVNNRDEFRDPHFIPRPDRRDYRMGFRRGYEVAVRHMYGGSRFR